MFATIANNSLPEDYSAVQSVEVSSSCARNDGNEKSLLKKKGLKETEVMSDDDDEKDFPDDNSIDEEDKMIFTPSAVSF
jgi:hypothetical protein